MSPAAAIRLRGVSKAFVDADGSIVQVLDNVHFSLAPGDKASLVGASGTGKSTLLALIAGLLEPDEGSVELNGVPMAKLSDTDRAMLRGRTVGIALQTDNLIPFLNAAENVALAIRLGASTPRRRVKSRVTELLDMFEVGHRAGHLPRHLSGGEVQRVSLAVALANDPDILLADEVVAQLDSATAGQVVSKVLEADFALLFVTHDVALGNQAERRFVLADGKVGHR